MDPLQEHLKEQLSRAGESLADALADIDAARLKRETLSKILSVEQTLHAASSDLAEALIPDGTTTYRQQLYELLKHYGGPGYSRPSDVYALIENMSPARYAAFTSLAELGNIHGRDKSFTSDDVAAQARQTKHDNRWVSVLFSQLISANLVADHGVNPRRYSVTPLGHLLLDTGFVDRVRLITD